MNDDELFKMYLTENRQEDFYNSLGNAEKLEFKRMIIESISFNAYKLQFLRNKLVKELLEALKIKF